MASSLARRMAEAVIRRASSGPTPTIALVEAPATGSIFVSYARATSATSFYDYDLAFPASSAASSVRGSSPTPSAVYVTLPAAPATTWTTYAAGTYPAATAAASSAVGSASAPSAVYVYLPDAPPTRSTSFPTRTFPAASSAGPSSIFAFADKFASPAASAAPSATSMLGSSPTPSAIYIVVPAAALASLTSLHAGAFPVDSFSSPASSAATILLPSSATPPPFRALAVTGSGAQDDRDSGSALSRLPSLVRNNTYTWSASFRSDASPLPYGVSRKRMFVPPSILPIGRRHYSGWAWTPWSPNRPKDAKTKAKELDDVIKFLRELEASTEDEKKLKEAFFDKFYAGKDVDPKSVELKLDLLLHKVDETIRLAKDIKGQKKWGTFRFFGKNLDLSSISNIATAIGGLF